MGISKRLPDIYTVFHTMNPDLDTNVMLEPLHQIVYESIGAKQLGSNAYERGPGRYRKAEEHRGNNLSNVQLVTLTP